MALGDRHCRTQAGLLHDSRRMTPLQAWAVLGAAFIMVAGISACGSSGPAPLSVRCSGHTLASPDSSEVDSGGPVTPPPVAAVSGIPHEVSAAQVSLADVDPDNPRLGYQVARQRASVSLISDGDNQPVWTTALHVLPGVGSSSVDLYAPITHYGYAMLVGGSSTQYITAVSSSGRQGPACVLPQLPTAGNDVELLPHAGVVIAQNPLNPSGSGDFSLDGYSATTGQRLWSVPTATSRAKDRVSYLVASDTVFVWQGKDANVAAYSARTGQHLWTAGATANPFASDSGLLGAFGGRVYASFDDGTSTQVLALSGTSGAVLWKRTYPSPEANANFGVTQVGSGEVLLGESVSRQELLLSARTGKTLAEASGSQGAAVGSGSVQVCSPGGHLAVAVPDGSAIHVLSDNPAFDRTIAVPQASSLDVVITDTEAYVLPSQDGAPVYGYDLATGKVLWTVPAGGLNRSDTQLTAFDGGFELTGSTDIAYR